MGPRTDLRFCLSILDSVLPEQLPSLTQDVPAQRIEQALQSTGQSTIRRRRLPAEQVVWLVLYHERWEIELGYDELKMEPFEQRESLRSKRVAAVEQEACGLLFACNLVRHEMVRIGRLCKVAPYRLRFAGMLRRKAALIPLSGPLSRLPSSPLRKICAGG